MSLGEKLKEFRKQKGISQTKLGKMLGHKTNSYVTYVEENHFIPSPEKLKKWLKILGVATKEADDLVLEARLEHLGIKDPSFMLMFKNVPGDLTGEEKQSIISAYEAVLKSRQTKSKSKGQ